MDFYEQVEQAVNCTRRSGRARRIRWTAAAVVLAAAFCWLAWSNSSLRRQRNGLWQQLTDLQTKHAEQMETLSGDLFETEQKLTDSRQRAAALELKNEELAKLADRAQALQADLNDAWADLDESAATMKRLTAGNPSRRSTVSSGTDRFARTDW